MRYVRWAHYLRGSWVGLATKPPGDTQAAEHLGFGVVPELSEWPVAGARYSTVERMFIHVLAVSVRRLSWHALFWPMYVCDRYLGRLGRALVLILHALGTKHSMSQRSRPRAPALAARSMLTCNKDRGWLPSRAQPERACDPGLGLIDT